MRLKEITLDIDNNLKQTMKFIDDMGFKFTFIVSKGKLKGIVTDGIIRNAILEGISLDAPIEEVMVKNPMVVHDAFVLEDTQDLVEQHKDLPINETMPFPVVSKDGHIKDVVFISCRGYEGSLSTIDIDYKTSKRILVIGGAGFLGSVLCTKLLNRGYKVRVLDKLLYGSHGLRGLDLELIEGDIRDINTVMNALDGVDAVIHLAAIVGDPASALEPKETIQINYLATKSIAEICKFNQINRFIFASTCSVYGASDDNTILTEESQVKPVSLYAEMKLKSEEGLINKEIFDSNFAPTVLRLGTLYGVSPRMRFDLVVNAITIRALMDKKFTIFGGEQYRAICNVEDAAEAFILCIEADINDVSGQIFNVSTGNVQISALGEQIHQLLPESEMKIDEKKVDIRNYSVSAEKIHKNLGFEGKNTIESTVKSIISNKFMYEDWKSPKYSNYAYLKGT